MPSLHKDPQRLRQSHSFNEKPQKSVSFRLEFEFSRSVFLDNVRVVLEAGRDSNPSRYEIKADRSLDKTGSMGLPFNFTFQIHNLGFFPVRDLLLNIAIPQGTRAGNQLLQITEFYIDQTDGSRCVPPKQVSQARVSPEDLSHFPQLNPSNTVTIPILCSVNLLAHRDITIRITGSLHPQTLHTVKFKTVDLLTTASIELDPSSSMFLNEEKPIILEIRKEGDYRIPIWIIIGSTLGGLLLLALLILALWKLGFFQRQKRRQEVEQEANGKVAEEREPTGSPPQDQTESPPFSATEIHLLVPHT
ncbi:hypothetical protein JZ751_019633 [Albula glossodonta]|uniref:Integrin alpha third immunoglobulin-like domain-containing protein n=1 Tax=Albula glossodonta TaxID=121402 RepID=A0A8T2NME9_9TELE|nr:hypothetical protein JZ751_019633 [Albula glossodonta]